MYLNKLFHITLVEKMFTWIFDHEMKTTKINNYIFETRKIWPMKFERNDSQHPV